MNQYPKEIATSLDELMRLEMLLSDFSLLPRQAVHSVLSGKHASKLRGRGLDFSEVRKYVYGDDIRNIDWKVTARTRQTHTKVFNEEKERPCFVILDQSSSMFFASVGSVKSVVAAQLAAISGFKVLKAGDRIGGLVFDDDSFETIQPKRSRKNLMHLLETIVIKNKALPQRQRVRHKQDIINKVLFKAKNVITHDYVVVVISDFQHTNAQGMKYLSSIAQHNDVIAIMVNDKMEQKLPDVPISVSDGEYQVMVKNKEKTLRKFEDSATDQRTNTIDYFMKYNIPFMEFNTHESLIEQIKSAFGK
ncbi:DUF58 domain-containing protein [Carboxylicivirga sp. M1479]|uniref:DUF58 domain-containing protein n=1 Tax=Carboxylicivirga sp. M1479 TaxID=2594476 RepID=UPI00117815D4|nr:DUF58 domain-containing protein [Carboxylicivirga sp. M1479]TRX72120.1 DUF58 domain-containing protein [Carboxylicivirga sp. M1479]